MATLLSRIRGLVVAEAHHAVDRAENPQVMSHQLVRDLSTELAAANRGLVAALGGERQLQRSRDKMEQEAADWERKAEALLRQGDEALTREALQRAVTQRQGAAALGRPLEQAGRTVQRLRGQVARLRAELERVRQRVTVIDAHQAASNALRSAGLADDAYSRAMDRAQDLDRYERRVEVSDCEAEAAGELLDAQDQMERRVAQAGAEAAVDEALAALRRKLAAADTQVTVTEQPQ